MTRLLALLITGTVSGGIYAILASGLVLNNVTSGVFNFAYGALAFAVAYVYYQLHVGLDLPILPAALLALLVFAPLLGLLLDRLIFQNLATSSPVAKIVATIGILVALPNLVFLLSDWLTKTAGVGLASRNLILLPPGIGPYPAHTWKIAQGATISSDQLAVFVAAIVVSFGLWYLIRRTHVGLQMRAVVDRRDLASLRAVDPRRVSTQSVVLTSSLAGLAGILIAPLFSLEPNQFTVLMFVSAAGAVAGRLRSIPLAMVGGLFVGLVQSLVAGYVDLNARLLPGLRSAVPFLLLFAFLFVLGQDRSRKAGQIADDEPPPDYLADLPPWRRALPWTVSLIALTAWIQTTSSFNARLAAQGIATAIVFLSFVVITGAGGLVPLAQAAFVTLGAMMAALATAHGVPFLPAALFGAVVACAFGLVVALPSLRLGGLSLALATLAAGFMADQMLFQIDQVTGGASGRPLEIPGIGPFDFESPVSYAMLLLLIFGLLALGVHNLLRSPTGRAMIAIRSSEVAAATSGTSPVAPKFMLFGVSAAIAGFGGTFLAANNLRINTGDYSTVVGLVWVAVMVVFGVRRIGGALIAGLMSTLFPELLRHITDTTLLPPVLFGLGAMNLAENPDGVMAIFGLKRQAKRQARRDRAAERAAVATPPAAAAAAAEAAALGQAVDPPSGGTSDGDALVVEGVRAAYAGAEVLHDVSFSVPRHGFVLLVGANGAGKSTICSVLAGLHAPSTGRVVLHGRDVTATPPHERVRQGLFLAPEYRGIFPGLSVEENLALWIRDRSARQHALDRFPMLAERQKTPAGNLSGGQQQLLTLAPALQRPPELLVLDEPSLGLAPIAASQVLEALAELHSLGTTVLLVEEHTRRALPFAQQVVLLELGRVRWVGPAAEFGDDLSREVYLGRSVAAPERVTAGVASAATTTAVVSPLPRPPATTGSSVNGYAAAGAQPSDALPATGPVALELEHVAVRFGGVRALDDVSLRVAPGSIHGLIGPNGAGKTTLFDVVSGVRPPDTGRVVLGGVDVTRWSSPRRARAGLRRTFQRVQVFGRLSVADNLLIALEHHGGGGGLPADVVAWPGRRRLEQARRRRVADVAALCGLGAVLDRPAGTLPVALARQVELGRALVDEPTVLLLDEPTSGLDDAESARLGGLIDRVARERRCAIVVVEHNVPFVMQHCATVTALDLGRVIAEGPAAEVQDDPAVQAAYFG